jgi:CRISPR-associated protein Cmr5
MNSLFPDGIHDEKLVNFFKGLPPMIMQNGLGQTIAFIMSKSNDDKGKNYKNALTIFEKIFGEGLINRIINAEIKDYIQMQKKAIECAGWIKKFALAFYVKPSSEERTNDDASPST